MTEGPLERLTDEIAGKMDECREKKNSLQQQCALLSEALTEEQSTNSDLLEALDQAYNFMRNHEASLGIPDGSDDETDTIKMIRAAIKAARS